MNTTKIKLKQKNIRYVILHTLYPILHYISDIPEKLGIFIKLRNSSSLERNSL